MKQTRQVVHTVKQSIFKDVYGCNKTASLVAPGNTNSGGRLSTVDLLIEVACFVKKNINDIFNVKRS